MYGVIRTANNFNKKFQTMTQVYQGGIHLLIQLLT